VRAVAGRGAAGSGFSWRAHRADSHGAERRAHDRGCVLNEHTAEQTMTCEDQRKRVMRRMVWSGVVVMLAGLAVATGAGCWTPTEGGWYDMRCDFAESGGGGGGGGSTPQGCVPNRSGEAVDDGCGVFVAASGDDAAAGTKAAPVKTIQQAVTRAQQE